MKLTEEKLKQMILEALKNKRFQDFGIPTPDEKLRSEIGDEMFDRIQAADPEQSEAFKQSFDPNYPRSIKQESLDDILIPAGLKRDVYKYNRPRLRKRHSVRTWTKKDSVNYDSVRFYTEYNIFGAFLEYTMTITTKKGRFNKQQKQIARGRIEISKIFELSLETEENVRDADVLVLSREKQAIEEALEQYK
jgi:hypothetical protein